MNSNFTPAMVRGISKHELYESAQLTDYIGNMFHEEDMDGAYEDSQTWEGLGLPQEHFPLQRVNTDGVRPSYHYRFAARSWTLGIIVPVEDKEDDLYGIIHKFFPMAGGEFARAYYALRQILGAQLFGLYGFQSGTSVPFSPDGVSFFSTAHPMSKNNTTQTWANRPSMAADLSVALAQMADSAMRTQKTPRGLHFMPNRVARVMIHPNERFVAKAVYRQAEEPYTTDRNKNFLSDERVDIVENPYWEYSGSVGALTNEFNSVVFQGQTHHCIWKKRSPMKTYPFFNNTILADVITTMKRFTFGIPDPRGLYGSPGN